jgi:predicted SprT family Zn-dependent metalloprotease
MVRDKEDIIEILDTICHELAHILFFNHSDEHKNTTENFKTIVIHELEACDLI